jgi:hypothetical protein
MSHWIWHFLGWAIALAVGAGVALWVYKKQSNKDLSYRVVSISPLVPLEARGFTDLKVYKGDRHIQRPFLTSILIVNTGDVDIRGGDFEVPLTIRPIGFGGPVNWKEAKLDFSLTPFHIPYKGTASFPPQVVEARVATTTPPKIPVELVVTPAQLQIKPLLLNAGDELTVEILINGDVRGIELGGRVAGVKQITEQPKPAVKSWREWYILIATVVVMLLAIGSASVVRLAQRR